MGTSTVSDGRLTRSQSELAYFHFQLTPIIFVFIESGISTILTLVTFSF